MGQTRKSTKIGKETHGLSGAASTAPDGAPMSPLIWNGATPALNGTYLRRGETL